MPKVALKANCSKNETISTNAITGRPFSTSD